MNSKLTLNENRLILFPDGIHRTTLLVTNEKIEGIRRPFNYRNTVSSTFPYFFVVGESESMWLTENTINKLINIASEAQSILASYPTRVVGSLEDQRKQYRQRLNSIYPHLSKIMSKLSIIATNFERTMDILRENKLTDRYEILLSACNALRITLANMVDRTYLPTAIREVVSCYRNMISCLNPVFLTKEMEEVMLKADALIAEEENTSLENSSIDQIVDYVGRVNQLRRLVYNPGNLYLDINTKITNLSRISNKFRERDVSLDELPETLRNKIVDSFAVTGCKVMRIAINFQSSNDMRVLIEYNHPRFTRRKTVWTNLTGEEVYFEFCVDSENHSLTNALLVQLYKSNSNLNVL